MKHQRHFESVSLNATRQAACLETMISDFRRTVLILDCDVQTEEERSEIFDPSDAHYSILARALAARRDNLEVTIAALEQRLSTARRPEPTEFTLAA
jgi:hypothetical protein